MVDDPRRPPADETTVLDAGGGPGRALASDADLPVVARLVVEIRSDGSRTVARGALEDVSSGVKTAVVARGSSPASLAFDLMRAVARLPTFGLGRGAVRGLLGRRSGDR
jgi:hypothetical protein